MCIMPRSFINDGAEDMFVIVLIWMVHEEVVKSVKEMKCEKEKTINGEEWAEEQGFI